jgi:hypothetical protein
MCLNSLKKKDDFITVLLWRRSLPLWWCWWSLQWLRLLRLQQPHHFARLLCNFFPHFLNLSQDIHILCLLLLPRLTFISSFHLGENT